MDVNSAYRWNTKIIEEHTSMAASLLSTMLFSTSWCTQDTPYSLSDDLKTFPESKISARQWQFLNWFLWIFSPSYTETLVFLSYQFSSPRPLNHIVAIISFFQWLMGGPYASFLEVFIAESSVTIFYHKIKFLNMFKQC